MRTDVCMHMQRHVYRHAHRRVHRHGYAHAHRHAYRCGCPPRIHACPARGICTYVQTRALSTYPCMQTSANACTSAHGYQAQQTEAIRLNQRSGMHTFGQGMHPATMHVPALGGSAPHIGVFTCRCISRQTCPRTSPRACMHMNVHQHMPRDMSGHSVASRTRLFAHGCIPDCTRAPALGEVGPTFRSRAGALETEEVLSGRGIGGRHKLVAREFLAIGEWDLAKALSSDGQAAGAEEENDAWVKTTRHARKSSEAMLTRSHFGYDTNFCCSGLQHL